MTEGVKENQESARPEAQVQDGASERSREHFKRLEAAKDAEREARIRAEMQNEMLRKEMQDIKLMMTPKEKDPLDEVEDYVDPARLRAKLEKERITNQREAERIAKEVYATQKREDDEKNVIPRLKSQYSDYDSVVNEDSLIRLQNDDPVFLEAVLDVKDDYKRRKLTYEYLKKNAKVAVEQPSIKAKVEENMKNPYHFDAGSGTNNPLAIDFDIKSKSARESAYDKLKAAQRRPVGYGQAVR